MAAKLTSGKEPVATAHANYHIAKKTDEICAACGKHKPSLPITEGDQKFCSPHCSSAYTGDKRAAAATSPRGTTTTAATSPKETVTAAATSPRETTATSPRGDGESKPADATASATSPREATAATSPRETTATSPRGDGESKPADATASATSPREATAATSPRETTATSPRGDGDSKPKYNFHVTHKEKPICAGCGLHKDNLPFSEGDVRFCSPRCHSSFSMDPAHAASAHAIKRPDLPTVNFHIAKKEDLICASCGKHKKSLPLSEGDKKFCSPRCHSAYTSSAKPVDPAVISPRHHFPEKPVEHVHKPKEPKPACFECGVEQHYLPEEFDGKKFCNPVCKRKYMMEFASKHAAPPKTSGSLTLGKKNICDSCGKEKDSLPFTMKDKKFCSPHCYNSVALDSAEAPVAT
eukprot:TRINITY_DN24_c0_g1_i8.p1 TRINITY_DN24_c0_g1~~TRINITY_DN24_c0_g1_i8.p1  ORF type:complete len:410 (-),score=101.40 TRINITY_DN24_c0_g1_i8:117-1346(-)